ncbi:MAG: TROVE domain-containing protein [Planctomycetota bacterium]
MANRSLFRSTPGRRLPNTDAVNEAGGTAYRLDEKHALAQLAATGCLNGTFYASAESQLDAVLELAQRVEPEFVARAALYARREARTKDMPALLVAVLSVRSPGLMAEVFDRVIDTPKMLRNFVQIVRSGVVGRKSLGSLPKRMVRQWLDARDDAQLFHASVGNDPSLADVIKLVHPKPTSPQRAALYAYLIGRPHETAALPEAVQAYEAFKRSQAKKRDVPDVPFQMLTALELRARDWMAISRQATWQTTRMNLNTFLRHGVFDDRGMVELIAQRLADPQLVRRSRVLPYQLLTAYTNASDALPHAIREALQDAMEAALVNVPAIDGKAFVLPDVSGSMQCPITGYRKGSTSKVRCVDVSALVAAAVLRKNPSAEVLPFECDVVTSRKARLNPRDTVLTNARKLAAVGGGGTNCSAPLRRLNERKAKGDLVLYVSDNQSWIGSNANTWMGREATETLKQWQIFKRRNPRAKMVCVDIQPYTTVQAPERDDITHVAGFSDAVFGLVAAVASGDATAGHWVRQIENQTL